MFTVMDLWFTSNFDGPFQHVTDLATDRRIN